MPYSACPEHKLLMHSVVREELAIAQLLNAQAEQVEAVVRQHHCPLNPDELIALQHALAKVLEMVVEAEKILLKKRQMLRFQPQRGCDYDW